MIFFMFVSAIEYVFGSLVCWVLKWGLRDFQYFHQIENPSTPICEALDTNFGESGTL